MRATASDPPHFDFLRIRRHWGGLADHAAAARYLDSVDAKLQRWLRKLGPWIDFDFAVRRLQRDLGLWQVKSHLTWLAFRRRLQLATEEKRRLTRDPGWRDEEIRVEVALSADGRHDAVWHEDFQDLYRRALRRERRELERLRETGAFPPGRDVVSSLRDRATLPAAPTRTRKGSGPRAR